MAKVTLINDKAKVRHVLGKIVPPGESTHDFEDVKLLNATIKDVSGLTVKGKVQATEKVDDSAAKKAAEETEAEKQRLVAEEAEKQKALQDEQTENSTATGWKK